jgi:hypothetical protein
MKSWKVCTKTYGSMAAVLHSVSLGQEQIQVTYTVYSKHVIR